MSRFACLLLTLLLTAAIPAGEAAAVLLSAGDGTGNTTAPPDDPGFANIGLRGDLTCIYLGNRWVLTANHVGFGDAVFGGVSYTAVTGSKVRLKNPNDSNADLQMFKLIERPSLPSLEISTSAPAISSTVTMIGNGRDRGAPTTFMGLNGWIWGGPKTIRWGTNVVTATSQTVLGTEAFVAVFDEVGLPHEAQVIVGDSGGGVFQKSGATWELVGTLFARGTYVGQPNETSIFGNETYAAELAVYRDQLVATLDQPACSDGLDDDADGLTDYPDDPGCTSASDNSEEGLPLPALGGAGIAGVVGLLIVLARRTTVRRRRAP